MYKGIYALYKGEDHLITGTIEEIAEHQNIKKATLFGYQAPSYCKRNTKGKAKSLVKIDEIPARYALYKKGKLLVSGTIEEIAEHQNVNPRTIHHYKSPSHLNRGKGSHKILVKLDQCECHVEESDFFQNHGQCEYCFYNIGGLY